MAPIIISLIILAVLVAMWISMLKEEKKIKKEIESIVPYDPTAEDPEHHFRATLKTLNENKVMVITKEDGIYVRLAGNVNEGEAFRYEWGKVVDFGKNKNMK
jgi:hypothetical protein